MREILGVDVGATGIKAAIVDVESGKLLTERHKILTPHPATPKAVAGVINQQMKYHGWKNKPVGIGFPAIIKNGYTKSAANVDKSWLDFNAVKMFQKELEVHVTVLNDADAAGMAEMKFGKAAGVNGLVVFLTLGTGIGSALFMNGELIPNTEFGHLKWKDSVAEHYAANSVREKKDLSWKVWAKELNKVLNHIEFLTSPDLIILGGGVSKKFSKFEDYLKTECTITNAKLLNEAGCIGAAIAASKNL